MTDGDPPIHVDVKLRAEAATRIVLAETFGLVSEVPTTVETGCGQRVPYAMTSGRPESVNCLACRHFAGERHLHAAEQAQRLGQMPGIGVAVERLAQVAQHHRDLAKRYRDLE